MSVKTRRICCIAITVLTFLFLAASYPFLPEQIPTHWGIDGPDEYNPKAYVWFFGGMAVLFNLLFEVVPKIDPKYQNYMKFIKEYNIFCVFMNFFMFACIAAMVIQCLRPGSFDMSQFACVMAGLTLLVTGNILPKFKPNFSSGIKTPWALADEENWRKTHRLGGKITFFSGLLWLFGAFFISAKKLVFTAGILSVAAIVIVPYVMSYVWWRRGRENP